ncbi:MAG: 2-succinyl-6-hydroxy-2,4-cyclohexadiene-1-carboxylate synthase [Firmicutes bacterium]|nr:2-succinyl-6-hydroxy-2,4-cyclohexadiene-1-carboxylate synthase [Bacillota bacterium]
MASPKYFSGRNLVLAYYTWGSPDNPGLLLLHGFFGNAHDWECYATSWASRYFVITPDLPGHGLSSWSTIADDMSVFATAAALKELMSSLGIDRYGVVGYSFGGRLAMHLSLLTGSALSCMVLESATPGIHDPEQRRARRIQDTQLSQLIVARGIEWFVSYWGALPLFASQTRLPPVVQKRIRQLRLRQDPRGLAQSLKAAGTGTQQSLWDKLETIRVPVLLITGTLDEKFCSIATTMQREWPAMQAVSIDSAGHNVHLEQPQAFHGAVDPFLQQYLGKERNEHP